MATILENVQTLSVHLEDAYTALEGKGATIPQQKNATNLSATVDSLPAAGITVDDLLQPSSAQVEELKDFVIDVPVIEAALTSSSLTAGAGYALFANRASIIKTADFEELSSIGNKGC